MRRDKVNSWSGPISDYARQQPRDCSAKVHREVVDKATFEAQFALLDGRTSDFHLAKVSSSVLIASVRAHTRCLP